MSISAYDFVHLALLAMDSEVDGKTRLQKTVYFLGLKSGELNDLGYKAHFYGPYSGLVAGAMDRLTALGFVDSNTTVWGIDDRGFEKYKTTYRLNEDGRAMALRKKKAHQELWDALCSGARDLKSLNNVDYMKLSIAAKTYYMLDKHDKGRITIAELKEMAPKFGWNISEEEIDGAAEVLEALSLASRQPTD